MIVCVCHRVSDRQICACLPGTFDDVVIDTGCTTCCGKCTEFVMQMVEKANAEVSE